MFEWDAVAQRFEMLHMAQNGPVAIASVEIVRAELLIRDAVAQDVVRDLEDLMRMLDAAAAGSSNAITYVNLVDGT